MHSEERPWKLTIVRAHGLQQLRAERSWRPIVTVTVGDHQCHELNLGSDGQNPNLKDCFQFHDLAASLRMDICVYYQAPSKKKNKRRNLVASACCTLHELARLQAQQQCEKRSVEIKLNSVARRKGGANKSKPNVVLLVAKLDLPKACEERPSWVEDDAESGREDSEDQGKASLWRYSSSPTTDSDEDPSSTWPEVQHPEPKVHAGYWSDSDRTRSGDERDPLIKRRETEPIVLSQFSDSDDGDRVQSIVDKLWFAASILPTRTYTDTTVNSQISTVDSIVDSFSPYRELREARVDSEYERVLTELRAEWRFVGGSLVALSGLEAGVFGFSSASVFAISKFSRRAVAVGSVASGIGLAIDAWFLLLYANVTSAKFQKMAQDVYGKYLFFSISARIPALCMFASALALMIFLLSVAWAAWPAAVLVMCFVVGVLVSLQFIVYGLHCVVVVVAEGVRAVRRGATRCLGWIRPSPPPASAREKPTSGG